MPRRVVILGAGPAGLWTALTLLERRLGLDVVVLEGETTPGGLTASFDYRGLVFDYGSHRLHPATRPDILERIREMLGEDLLTRPRNGRILLENRFIAFPLRPADLLLHLPPSFPLGVIRDSILKPLRRRSDDTFEDILLSGLGRTVSRRFYFPYAEKLWGIPAGSLSPVQARKRVSASNLGKMTGRIFSRNDSSSKVFYYPERGFGQIAGETSGRIKKLGGRIIYGSRITSVSPPEGTEAGSVSILADNGAEMIPADFVFSTLPLTDLIEMIKPSPPVPLLESARKLSYRSMVYCFLELPVRTYTPYDAHYFPGREISFSRMSEPGNYSGAAEPQDRTGLCFEIPCTENDTIWNLSGEGVRDLVMRDLAKTGLPVPDVLSFTVRRKRSVYPVYALGYSEHFERIDTFLTGLGRLVSLGRQGLFVHDNTHHTIEMGIAAGRSLSADLSWDEEHWQKKRMDFEKHIVVD